MSKLFEGINTQNINEYVSSITSCTAPVIVNSKLSTFVRELALNGFSDYIASFDEFDNVIQVDVLISDLLIDFIQRYRLDGQTITCVLENNDDVQNLETFCDILFKIEQKGYPFLEVHKQ